MKSWEIGKMDLYFCGISYYLVFATDKAIASKKAFNRKTCNRWTNMAVDMTIGLRIPEKSVILLNYRH